MAIEFTFNGQEMEATFATEDVRRLLLAIGADLVIPREILEGGSQNYAAEKVCGASGEIVFRRLNESIVKVP